jgi:glycosyltransferase involved in cell wall biosynthesis
VGGIADLILPGLTGFTFEVESDAGLAECIINTSKEPDLASRVAQEAQRYIRTNPRFDPANNTKRVLEVFRCAMEGKPVADAGFNP